MKFSYKAHVLFLNDWIKFCMFFSCVLVRIVGKRRFLYTLLEGTKCYMYSVHICERSV